MTLIELIQNFLRNLQIIQDSNLENMLQRHLKQDLNVPTLKVQRYNYLDLKMDILKQKIIIFQKDECIILE